MDSSLLNQMVLGGTKILVAGLLTSWMSSAIAADTAIQNVPGAIRLQGAVAETPWEVNR